MCRCEDRPCCGCSQEDVHDVFEFDDFDIGPQCDEFAPEDDIDPDPDSDTGECDAAGEPPYMEDSFIDSEYESRYELGE